MRSSLVCLLGAVGMGAGLNLPFLHPSWLHQLPTMILLIGLGATFYAGFLYCFLWPQFKALLGGMFVHRA
jgi:hypothetical protein